MDFYEYLDMLSDSLKSELLPCPCCGWPAGFRGAGNSVYAVCPHCGVIGPGFAMEAPREYRPGLKPEEAFRKALNHWNSRYTNTVPITKTLEWQAQNMTWTTREGKVLKVKDMTTAHIKNCMRMLGGAGEVYPVFEYELKRRGESLDSDAATDFAEFAKKEDG